MMHNIALSDEARDVLEILVAGYELCRNEYGVGYTSSLTGSMIFSREAVQECEKHGFVGIGTRITSQGRQWLLIKHHAEYLQALREELDRNAQEYPEEIQALVASMQNIERFYKEQRDRIQEEIMREGS